MRNEELFSPGCPDDRARRLVLNYALRGLPYDRGCHTAEELLAVQHGIYLEWLAALRASRDDFSCGFYEWLAREEDAAFIFKPGDLVKYDGRYCVVTNRPTCGVSWGSKWRVVDGRPAKADWPQLLTALDVREADGRIHCVHGLDHGLEPADIPPEVFALACGRAKDCPMLKGGRDGE